MKRLLAVTTVIGVCLLGGCGPSQSDLDGALADLEGEINRVESRLSDLESKVEDLEMKALLSE